MIKYEPWMDRKQVLDLAYRGLLKVRTEDIRDFISCVWNDGFDEGYDTGKEDGYEERDAELRQE